MKGTSIGVKPKDLAMIIRRGINTLDQQMMPAWANEICDTLAETDAVIITFLSGEKYPTDAEKDPTK